MHQARFWYLLLVLYYPLILGAQSPSIEVDWHYYSSAKLQFEVRLKPISSDQNCFLLKDAEILAVRKAQGRLKEALNFQYQDNELCVELPSQAEPYRIYIKYRLPEEAFLASPFINPLEPGFAMNALNIEDGLGNGELGLLLPSPKDGSAQWVRINLSLDEALNIESPLLAEFQVLDKGRKSIFLYSAAPLRMTDFYLALGDFKRFKVRDIQEQLLAQASAQEDRQIENFEAQHRKVLDYISAATNHLFMRGDFLDLINRPSPSDLPLLPSLEELPGSKTLNLIDYGLFKQYFPQTYVRRWAEFWQGEFSASQWSDLLTQRKEAGDSSALFWEYHLAESLKSHGLEWRDTLSTQSKKDSLYLARAVYFLQRRRALPISISYQIQMQEGLMYFYTNHGDTNLRLISQFSGQMLFDEDTLNFQVPVILSPRDTFTIAIPKAPLSIYLDADSEDFVRWEENRSLNYLLFDLSRGPNEKIKREALIKLIEIASPRLLTTVVGIALDNNDPEVQLLALAKVKDLSPNGIERLRASIEKMAAEADNVKVKQKAKEALQNLAP